MFLNIWTYNLFSFPIISFPSGNQSNNGNDLISSYIWVFKYRLIFEFQTGTITYKYNKQ